MLPIEQVTLFKEFKTTFQKKKVHSDFSVIWFLLTVMLTQPMGLSIPLFAYAGKSHMHSSVPIMQQTSTRAKTFFNRMKISIVEFNNSRTLIFVNNVCWKSQRIKQFLELWSFELDAQWIMEWTRMFPRTTLKPRYSPIFYILLIDEIVRLTIFPSNSLKIWYISIRYFDILFTYNRLGPMAKYFVMNLRGSVLTILFVTNEKNKL